MWNAEWKWVFFSFTLAVGKLLNQRRVGMGWEKCLGQCNEPSLLKGQHFLQLPAASLLPAAHPSGHTQIPRALGSSLSYWKGHISQKSGFWIGSWTLLGENRKFNITRGKLQLEIAKKEKNMKILNFLEELNGTDWEVICVFYVTFRLGPDPGWWTASIFLEFEGRAVHLAANARAGWRECHS